jgi:hypothetical protein
VSAAGDAYGVVYRSYVEVAEENATLRSLVELMAMRIPAEHIPEPERALLEEILGNQ